MSDPDSTASLQPRQAAVYRKYLQLQSIAAARFPEALSDVLAGRLVACVGVALEGPELALATTIAGGTFLGIDPSSDHLKAAVRNGSCDFMVNTLDESLRVLKNELRKHKALAVGLLGDASAILPAMVDRGVQPDLVAETPSSQTDASLYRPALLQLIERGAKNIDMSAEKLSPSAGQMEVVWTAANLADWKRMDALALQQLPPADTLRRRWLQQASGCFHRQHPLQRVLHLQPDELSLLLHAFQVAMYAGELQEPATVAWQAADGRQQSIHLQRP
jgi:urocanate hydratase